MRAPSSSRRSTTGGIVLAAVVLATAACADPNATASSNNSSTSLPDEIELISITELSGAAGPFGIATANGQETAVDEINESGFLGDTKLTLTVKDTGLQAATGASLMQQAATSGAPVVLGSVASVISAAEAPIAQRSGVPYVQLASGGDIAKVGDHIFTATAPQAEYLHLSAEYLADQELTSVGVIYNSDVPTTAMQAETQFPAVAADAGVEIVDTVATTVNAADTSGAVSRILSNDPDAVAVFVQGTSNVTIVSQLRQAGFDGTIIGGISMGSGVLTPLGDAADGVLWATSFTPLLENETATNFTERYTKLHDSAPNNFAADGYNSVWFVARALKEAGTVNRQDILEAMGTVGDEGFQGANGTVTFQDRVATAEGVLIRWEDGQEVPVEGFGG